MCIFVVPVRWIITKEYIRGHYKQAEEKNATEEEEEEEEEAKTFKFIK